MVPNTTESSTVIRETHPSEPVEVDHEPLDRVVESVSAPLGPGPSESERLAPACELVSSESIDVYESFDPLPSESLDLDIPLLCLLLSSPQLAFLPSPCLLHTLLLAHHSLLGCPQGAARRKMWGLLYLTEYVSSKNRVSVALWRKVIQRFVRSGVVYKESRKCFRVSLSTARTTVNVLAYARKLPAPWTASGLRNKLPVYRRPPVHESTI